MKYYICNGTDSRNFIANALDEVKQLSDELTGYTQTDIYILEIVNDEIYKVCCKRQWWGVPFDNEVSDDVNPICFGDLGYYGDWE